MHFATKIISPFNNGLGLHHNFGLFAVIFLILLMYLLYQAKILSKHKDFRYLALMMTALGTLMLVLTLILNVWNAQKIGDLVFEENQFVYQDQVMNYNAIDKLYVEPSYQKSRYSGSINTDTVNFAVLELRDGKTFIFSEEHYDLFQLFEAFKLKRVAN